MPNSALELKGRMLALTRVRLLSPEVDAIRAQLGELAHNSPEAATGMPVVVDADFDVDLPAVWKALQDVGMQPVGVSEGRLAAAARAAGLSVLADAAESRPRKAAAASATAAAAPATARRSTRIVEQAVRSGQQIYATEADLVLLAPVSAGAEVIADGCIHAYAPLRGRAIAGARGDEGARVFCRRLEAELIAVGGVYAVAEQMQAWRGRAVQAYLRAGKLHFEPMNP